MKCNQPVETGSRTLNQAVMISAVQVAGVIVCNSMVSALIGNRFQFFPTPFFFPSVRNISQTFTDVNTNVNV